MFHPELLFFGTIKQRFVQINTCCLFFVSFNFLYWGIPPPRPAPCRNQKGNLNNFLQPVLGRVPGPAGLAGICPPSFRYILLSEVNRFKLVIPFFSSLSFYVILLSSFAENLKSVEHRYCEVTWCDWEGKPTSLAGPLPSVDMVSRDLTSASPSMLRFRNPEKFISGNLSGCLPHWKLVLKDYPKASEIFRYVSEGVRVQEFLVPFKGTFRGRSYNADVPPRVLFPNSSSCNNFHDFVAQTILERVANGSLLVWGEVGKVDPPHLVLPIMVESSKPRMCHDERFLNCWIKDCPFSLDYITDLPHYASVGHYQTTFDDKSGYDHVRLHPSSSTFFGLEWEGWYFLYTTLPFGWKASAYLYHSIGLAVTCYVRSLGVPCSQYIDNRHHGQLRLPPSRTPSSFSGFQLAEMAAFIACSTFVSLGYFIGIKKSCLIPSIAVIFLGYICDSEKQAFLLPQDKTRQVCSLKRGYIES